MFQKRTELDSHQEKWASDNGIQLDPKYPKYVSRLESNLLLGDLTVLARIDFTKGKGSELKDGVYPAKMRALHSSSALVANVFDYWTDMPERSALSKALAKLSGAMSKAPNRITNMRYEYQPGLPTGTASPNLDVILIPSTKNCTAIESKFTEWLEPHEWKESDLPNTYFAGGKKHWEELGLPNCQRLAEEWRFGKSKPVAKHLNVPQLLKHALGLAYVLNVTFDLWYLFYDFDNSESRIHKQEICEFNDRVGSEIRFRSFSYQDFVECLKNVSTGGDQAQVTKFCERYGL